MIPVLTISTLTALFTLAFSLYSKWQFEHAKHGYYNLSPEATLASDRWHKCGLAMRIIFALSIAAVSLLDVTIMDILFATSFVPPLFDILINILALDKPLLYVGNRDNDKSFEWDNIGMLKWPIYAALIAAAAYFRFFYN